MSLLPKLINHVEEYEIITMMLIVKSKKEDCLLNVYIRYLVVFQLLLLVTQAKLNRAFNPSRPCFAHIKVTIIYYLSHYSTFLYI